MGLYVGDLPNKFLGVFESELSAESMNRAVGLTAIFLSERTSFPEYFQNALLKLNEISDAEATQFVPNEKEADGSLIYVVNIDGVEVEIQISHKSIKIRLDNKENEVYAREITEGKMGILFED